MNRRSPPYIIALVLCISILVGGCATSGSTEPGNSVKAEMKPRQEPASAIRKSRAEQLFVHGMTLAFTGDTKGAIAAYQESLELNPGEAAVLSALAEAYAETGSFSTAVFYASQAADRAPGNVHYREQVAQLQLSAGDTGQATETYRSILKQFPEHYQALYELANIQTAAERYGEALATYRQAMDLLGESREVYERILQLQTRTGDKAGMEQSLKALIRLDPTDTSLYTLLSQFYASEGRRDDALAVLNESRSINPEDVDAALSMADMYREMGLSAQADSVTGAILSTQNASPAQLLARATALYRRAPDDPVAIEAAIPLFRQVYEAEPGNVEARSLLGELLLRTGKAKEASLHLEAAVEANPRDVALWQQAATAFLQAGEPRRAAELSEEGLLLFPGQLTLMRVSSFGLIESYQNQAAIRRLEDAIRVHREDGSKDRALLGEFLSSLALVQSRLRNYNASDSLYALAIEADAGNPFVLNNFAFNLADRAHRLADALKYARRAVELDSTNAAFLDTFGWVYFKQKQYEQARTWIEKAVQTGQASAAVYEHLGDVYERLGNKTKAGEYWKTALDRNPNNPALRARLESRGH